MNLDIYLFNLIYNLSRRSICFDSLGIFIAQSLIFFIPILIFLVWLLKKDKKILKGLLFGFFSAILVYLFDFLIEKIYFRSRPFVSLNFIPLIEVLPSSPSFPSTHTALAFALAFSLYFINRRLGIIFLVLALLIGISRIFVGVHWPSDVLSGIILGFIFSSLINKVLVNKFLNL